MKMTTKYLGLTLPHPLMPGASPLTHDLDKVRGLEDAGAAAIVMHSLFEEQITPVSPEERAHPLPLARPRRPFATGPEEYLEQVHRIKEAVRLPVIASLNGTSPGGWLEFSRLLHQAGADALELNVYTVATDPDEGGEKVERRTLDMVRSVREAVPIPLAVKLAPYYSSVASFARELVAAGADGLVLFNRFYEPDLDIESREVVPSLHLSEPVEIRLRLRWLAVLSGTLDVSLAATGGVHGAAGAVKAVMCGAHAAQMVTPLLAHGVGHLATVRKQLEEWLEDHGVDSLEAIRGSSNLKRSRTPAAFERANYVETLKSWSG